MRSETIIFENLEKDSNFKIITLHEIKTTTNDYCKSPECLRGETSIKSDIWALGVLIYFGLSKELPFTGRDQDQVKRNIQRGVIDYKNPALELISDEAINLMKSMMTYVSGMEMLVM